ncbi:MAG: hypothetical protein RSA97_07435 [Oscillospiraceae bacterium]
MRISNKRLAAARIFAVLDFITLAVMLLRIYGQYSYNAAHPEVSMLFGTQVGKIVISYIPILALLSAGAIIMSVIAKRECMKQAEAERDKIEQTPEAAQDKQSCGDKNETGEI